MPRKARQTQPATALAQSNTARSLSGGAIRATAEFPDSTKRNGRFYAQLWMTRNDGQKTARKFPLLTPEGAPVASLSEAKEAAEVLRNDRREKNLPTSGHQPRFADYIETYFLKPVTARKKPATLKLERWALKRWQEHLGDVRIDRIPASLSQHAAPFFWRRAGSAGFQLFGSPQIFVSVP